jgi:hypothetical protein
MIPVRFTMPFPRRGCDTDKAGEFMNETVAAYCHTHGKRERLEPEINRT